MCKQCLTSPLKLQQLVISLVLEARRPWETLQAVPAPRIHPDLIWSRFDGFQVFFLTFRTITKLINIFKNVVLEAQDYVNRIAHKILFLVDQTASICNIYGASYGRFTGIQYDIIKINSTLS